MGQERSKPPVFTAFRHPVRVGGPTFTRPGPGPPALDDFAVDKANDAIRFFRDRIVVGDHHDGQALGPLQVE